MNKYTIFFAIFIIQYSLFTPLVSADWLIDRSGTLVKIDPRILGDDDTQEIKVEDRSGSDSRSDIEEVKSSSEPSSTAIPNSEQQKKEQERTAEIVKKNTEFTRKASDKAKEDLKKRIEKNEIKAIRNKIEAESEIKIEDGKFKVKQKIKDQNGQETETELEMDQGEEVEVESSDGDETQKFRLKTRDDDGVEIERNNIRVRTNLPISINADNKLVVTRPDGTQKVVAVMPDQALSKLKEQNIITSDDSADLPELEEEDGQSVYKVDGQKQEKILGLFNISYKTKAVVSAETGDVVRTEVSGLDRFLSLFSF